MLLSFFQLVSFCQPPIFGEPVITTNGKIKKISTYTRTLPYAIYKDSVDLDDKIALPAHPDVVLHYNELSSLSKVEFYNKEGQIIKTEKSIYQNGKLKRKEGINTKEYEYFDNGLIKITSTDNKGQKLESGFIQNNNGQIEFQYSIDKDTTFKKYYHYNEKGCLLLSILNWKNGKSLQTYNVYNKDGDLKRTLSFDANGSQIGEIEYVKENEYESYNIYTDRKGNKENDTIELIYHDEHSNIFKTIKYFRNKTEKLIVNQYVYEYYD